MRINLKNALKDLQCGILNAFPPCCIVNYCLDTLLDREEQKMKRHIIGLKRNGYCPCLLCIRAYKQTYQHAVIDLALESQYVEDKDFWLLPEHVKALVLYPPKL